MITDEICEQAKRFVREQGKVSIAKIQREFRMYFTDALRIIERLEKDGIITAPDGDGRRFVVIGEDDYRCVGCERILEKPLASIIKMAGHTMYLCPECKQAQESVDGEPYHD